MNETLNAEKLAQELSKYISAGNSYIDALLEYSKVNDIEVELLGEIIRRSPGLKSRIQDEAAKLHLVEPRKGLPV